jgi:hypothetical protein
MKTTVWTAPLAQYASPALATEGVGAGDTKPPVVALGDVASISVFKALT